MPAQTERSRVSCVGIYVADDQLITGVLTPKRIGQLSVNDLYIIRTDYKEGFESTLDRALAETAKHLELRELVCENIAIAVPGPVKMSGIRIYEENQNKLNSEYGTFGSTIRRQELADFNIAEFVTNSPSFVFFGHCLVYHDAAAYAYGDYCMRRAEKTSNYKHRRHYDKTAIQLTILVDEGIGGAVVQGGAIVQGPSHPEIGHSIVERHPDDVGFTPACAVHNRQGCLEGYASLPALRARWQQKHSEGDILTRSVDSYSSWSSKDPRIWRVAYYLAQVIVNGILFVAPSQIVLCGRVVTGNEFVLPIVKGYVCQMLITGNGGHGMYPGYSHQTENPNFIDIVRHVDCGAFGACMLAFEANNTAKILGYKISGHRKVRG